MTKTLTPFIFEDQNVRVVSNGDTMFVAADVCKVLGLSNVSKALNALDDDEKGITSSYTPSGKQEMLGVTESGLYCLILRSRKAVTPGTIQHRFRKWVTSELLPAVRKGQVQTTAKPADDRALYWMEKIAKAAEANFHWPASGCPDHDLSLECFTKEQLFVMNQRLNAQLISEGKETRLNPYDAVMSRLDDIASSIRNPHDSGKTFASMQAEIDALKSEVHGYRVTLGKIGKLAQLAGRNQPRLAFANAQ